MRESKSEPSFPAAFLLSQPALNRLDLTDALSTLLLISFLLRFKIAARTPSALRLLLSSVATVAQPRRKVNKEIKESRIRATSKDGFPLESMQRVCTLEAELALLLRISYKYRKSGAQGSHHRFETKFGRELSVDVDKQRMVIAPILRLVFSLTSLVDTSEFFQVSNKVVRGVLEFIIRGHALLFDQILREDLSGADELTMEQVNLVVSILTKIWPYEESDDGFVQGLFTMMRVIFSLDLDSFISNKSMCYIEMDGMSESELNQALNIELKHIIEVLSL
nr:nuclear pore complex protein NUP205 [Ipomoea batatas]